MDRVLFERIAKNEQEVLEKYTVERPVKLGDLAKELGLVVVRSTLGSRISGQIMPSSSAPAGFEIKLNRYDSPERQRFTLAHEIAHYLLHRDFIGNGVFDNVLYRSNLSSRKEVEANKLAADIIMPRSLVRADFARKNGGELDIVKELATLFRVSEPAMRVRLGIS